jgi:hypothetical protein
MHVYTPNGSVMIIANSPEHADQVYKRVMGIPEEAGTGLTWTEVPATQVIEAWQIRQQTAEAWVQQLGVAEGVQLCLEPEGDPPPRPASAFAG